MSLREDYQLIREGAALAELMPRGRVGISGPDRASFLQGLLTNDIQALGPGNGCYAAWLTPQGRMTTDMHVLESGDMILLDLPAAQLASVLERLEKFLFSEDVRIADLSSTLAGVTVHGPQAGAVIARAVAGFGEASGWAAYQNACGTFADGAIVIARIDQLGVPGFVVYVAGDREGQLRARLVEAGGVAVDAAAVAAARIEAGYPIFGADMDEETIPLEAGIESRAISFSKGCYVGQEVVIRVLHRGHGRVARRLVGLRMEGDRAAAPGSRLQAGGKDVGSVTSGALSPATGAIALGYVHRDFVEPGTRLDVVYTDGVVRAVVSAFPLVSEV